MQNNILDQHIEIHEKALRNLRTAKSELQILEYHFATKKKASKTNQYLEKLIAAKQQALKSLLINYDLTVSELIPEPLVSNPIFERHGNI